MLKQRIITALILLAVLLPALFAPNPDWFLLVGAVAMAAGSWEWARLNGASAWAPTAGAVMALVCAAFWYCGFFDVPHRMLWLVIGTLWVLGGGWLLKIGVAGWPKVPQAVRLLGGWAVLLAAWLAMGQARHAGVAFLLSIMALVWTADVFAYFFGKALGGKLFGGRKLAPAISPGKSWEGALGGMFGVLVLAFSWLALERGGHVGGTSYFTALYDAHGPVVFVLGLVFLTAMSGVGDLSESLVKRSAGVKDSSQLLPGHGGVLDRIDALVPVMPLAALIYTGML